MKNSALCLASALFLSAFVRADGVSDPSVVLELFVSEGNPRNTEGDFVALKDGRILLVYTRFTGGGSDHDKADLVSRVNGVENSP